MGGLLVMVMRSFLGVCFCLVALFGLAAIVEEDGEMWQGLMEVEAIGRPGRLYVGS